MRTTARATSSARSSSTGRTGRPARRNAALAVAALAALSLTLTACGGGNGNGNDGSSGSSGDEASGASKGTAGSGEGETASPPDTGGPVPKAAGDGCTLATTEVRLEDTGGTAPIVLLRITNNGSKTCPVFGAPVVSDPTAGKNLPVAETTRPRSVVRVEPARSAYAAINLAGLDADRTHRSKTFGVSLASKDGRATNGRVTVTSPGVAGLLLNADSHVTHWQHTLEDAMS